MDVKPQLSYFDFPFSQRAFCESRGATSHMYTNQGVHFRHYGRNIRELTLVGWEPGAPVRAVLEEELGTDAKLKTVNFIDPEVDGSERHLPLLPGPREWFMPPGWEPGAGSSKKHRYNLRRACRGLKVNTIGTYQPDMKGVVDDIFEGWLRWADGRHFMVFKGHYRRWLDEFLCTANPRCFLVIIEHEERGPVGMFGGEVHPMLPEAQITIAKHKPELDGKAMWVLGLEALRSHLDRLCLMPHLVHCGSTADQLKQIIGLTPLPSWKPDLKRIKAEL